MTGGSIEPSAAILERYDVLLDEVWTLYFHDPLDAAWTTQSYVRLSDVSSAADYASATAVLGDRLTKGMFFLMREQVFPCWDDKNNIDGGCACMKVPSSSVERYWDELCVRLLSESLWKQRTTDPAGHPLPPITGISVSPKMNYSVIKVWIGSDLELPVTDRRCDPQVSRNLDLPPGYVGDVIFRYNRDVIGQSQERASNKSCA